MSLPPPVKYSTEVLDSSKNIGSSLGTISPHKKGFGNPHLPHVLRGWEGGLKWGRNIATTLPAHLQKISLSFKSISSHRVVIDIFLRLLHVLLEAITSSCIYLSSTANRLLSAFPRNTHPGYVHCMYGRGGSVELGLNMQLSVLRPGSFALLKFVSLPSTNTVSSCTHLCCRNRLFPLTLLAKWSFCYKVRACVVCDARLSWWFLWCSCHVFASTSNSILL